MMSRALSKLAASQPVTGICFGPLFIKDIGLNYIPLKETLYQSEGGLLPAVGGQARRQRCHSRVTDGVGAQVESLQRAAGCVGAGHVW